MDDFKGFHDSREAKKFLKVRFDILTAAREIP